MLIALVKWILFGFSLIFVAWLVPGVTISSFLAALGAVAVIGLINILIKPLLLFLTIPINILTLGLFTIVINAFLFWLSGKVMPGFYVDGVWASVFGSILFSILSIFINRF